MRTTIVKPYVSKEDDYVGLSELGLNRWPGSKVEFSVPIKNNKFATGLDPTAWYLALLTPEQKEREIKRIEAECQELNAQYPHLKLCDCSLSNEFYANLEIKLNAGPTYFNPDLSIEDRIRISVIKTMAKYVKGRDSIVAPSLKHLKESNENYRYYLSDEEVDIEVDVKHQRKINKAIVLFDDLFEENKPKFLLVLKYLLPADKMYNRASETRRYKKLDEYIRGIIKDEDTRKTNYDEFVKAVEMADEELLLDVVIKYAIYGSVIRTNKDKEFYYTTTNQVLGRTIDEVRKFLSLTKNHDIYDAIREEVDAFCPILV